MSLIEKCCKYCHHFIDGSCRLKIIAEAESNIDNVIEDGYLAEAVQEGFTDKEFDELDLALRGSGLSGTKIKEVKRTFYDELERIKNLWIEDISYNVETMLQNKLETEINFIPKDKDEFYCRYWE
jgi:hypothetical protein